MPAPRLDETAQRLLAEARRAVLTTLDPGAGRPRSVPICFVGIAGPRDALVLYSPLDEKPKASPDPRTLRRVRNLEADPRATVLVDRWDEDWSQLAWALFDVEGRLVGPDEAGHATAIQALREKYPQYRDHHLEARPILSFEIVGAVSWAAAKAHG